jgi:hypothetical protein
MEIDHDLASDAWETLKALRSTTSQARVLNQSVLEHLISLRLAAISGSKPVITETGRKVLVRGSPRLWDVAA